MHMGLCHMSLHTGKHLHTHTHGVGEKGPRMIVECEESTALRSWIAVTMRTQMQGVEEHPKSILADCVEHPSDAAHTYTKKTQRLFLTTWFICTNTLDSGGAWEFSIDSLASNGHSQMEIYSLVLITPYKIAYVGWYGESHL